jgi:hypothetical protein
MVVAGSRVRLELCSPRRTVGRHRHHVRRRNRQRERLSGAGFSVAAALASWVVRGYGHPAPSIQFSSAAGISTDGEVRVTAAGRPFRFESVDLYSSTTPIPFVFT